MQRRKGHKGPADTPLPTFIFNPEGKCSKQLSVAKITSAFIFIAFQPAQIGRSNRPSTVKTSVLLFNFSVG
jgi:hypothetical protein